MRAVVQRVLRAEVRVADAPVAAMGPGLPALVGVGPEDDEADAEDLARRLAHLRVFTDAAGKMNESLLDRRGTLGVVSQFTLMGDARKGRRPSFVAAAAPAQAEPLVAHVAESARALGLEVVTGRFGAHMEVTLVNDGPVTLLLDSAKQF